MGSGEVAGELGGHRGPSLTMTKPRLAAKTCLQVVVERMLHRLRAFTLVVPEAASHSSKPAGERGCHTVLVIRRIVAYADGNDLAASRDFYIEVLGLEVAMEDPVLGLRSPANPTAQVIIPPRGMENPPPRVGIDVGEPTAVDAAHAAAVRRGSRVAYPLTEEPWGVRRFFVEDPGGTVVNVLAHLH